MAKAKPTVASLAAHIERELDAEAKQRTLAVDAVRSRMIALFNVNADAIGAVGRDAETEGGLRRTEDAKLRSEIAALHEEIAGLGIDIVTERAEREFERDWRSATFANRLRWLFTGK